MRAIEFLTESRNGMYQYIKSIVPTWPDYIVKDWLYPGFSRYNDKTKRELLLMLNREGLNRNTQWQLVPNMKFTMDIWTSHTLKKLQGRAGGLSDMGMDIPRDAERHATQAQLAQQQGGVRSEPVILIKRPDGYELLEGWHRTIQHFHKFPDGYTGPAYVAVAQNQQGVAEGSQEINWVKPNFDFEWHEVEEQSRMKQVPVDVRQYYQKHFPNKDAWLKAVQNGKAVVVPPDHAYEIRNAPFDKASLQKVLAPTGHEGPIGPAKEKRVNDLFDKGQVEMPIILKTSQGLWLIGGKTRLGTANYVKGLPAKVWLISGEQGVAEGPTDDSRFQKMMGKIQKSTPTPMSGYVALSFASEGRSKKIKGVKHNGKPMPDVIDDPEEFLGGKIEFTPDQIEQELMSIGEKYGWDSIDPGQGQGYTEMFFDTSREYTSNNQSRLAANIVRTVNEINKFFNSINRSLQSTGLPGYTADVWQGMGPPDNINQIEDLTQITSIAKKQDVEESSLNEFDPGEDGFGV